ncbi:MAG: LURP-one-related/scramblase family protein [Ilumatobacteraceae bacterium]
MSDDSERIRDQVSGDGWSGAGLDGGAFAGGGTLFTEPILVVNQKAKIIELTNQYSIYDQHGTPIAQVNQVGQSWLKKVLRLVSSLDQFLTHTLEVSDNTGAVQLRIVRPGKIVKSRIIVSDGAGAEIGRIMQKNVIGKINFALIADGQDVGAIKAENWRAWNFSIEDASGQEVARITKTFEGVVKTAFTTADNYVVQIHKKLDAPLLPLVIASAVSVDTALKQDKRGLG